MLISTKAAYTWLIKIELPMRMSELCISPLVAWPEIKNRCLPSKLGNMVRMKQTYTHEDLLRL